VEREAGRLWSWSATDLERWGREHENLRVAMEWSLVTEEGAVSCPRLAWGLGGFWDRRGYYSEAFEWLRRSVEKQVDLPPLQREMALFGAAFFAERLGDHATARGLLEQSLPLCREPALRHLLPERLKLFSMVAFSQGDYPVARAASEECMALSRASGD